MHTGNFSQLLVQLPCNDTQYLITKRVAGRNLSKPDSGAAANEKEEGCYSGFTSDYVATEPTKSFYFEKKGVTRVAQATTSQLNTARGKQPVRVFSFEGEPSGQTHKIDDSSDLSQIDDSSDLRYIEEEEEGCYTGGTSDYVATEPSHGGTQPVREGEQDKPHP
jgi:hypothetical protein